MIPKADQDPRPRLDRLINRLTRFRGVAARSERHASGYRTPVIVAAILPWL